MKRMVRSSIALWEIPSGGLRFVAPSSYAHHRGHWNAMPGESSIRT